MREDGLVFLRYNKGRPEWLTREIFDARRAHLNAQSKAWQAANPEKAKANAVRLAKARKERDPVAYLAYAREANRKRYARLKAEGRLAEIYASTKRWVAKDPSRAEAARMRKRIYIALQNVVNGQATKAAGTDELLGCSRQDLMKHLESQFLPGMSWENRSEWHIDHIRPCASFDLTDPAQQRLCFHYSNLRPLWAADNIRKGARYVQF